MKRKILQFGSLALAGMLYATTGMTAHAAYTVNTKQFDDYNSSSTWDWAGDHIYWAKASGIVAGKENNCFDADGLVTRAEAATMMVKFKEIDVEQYDTACEQFADVGEEWYAKYINAAYTNGLVSGKTESTFDPEGLLTRAEAATLVVSAMGYEMETEGESVFTDIGGSWYTDYINTAYAHEIVAGKSEGTFDPSAKVSRAEMVTMLHSTMKESFEMGVMCAVDMDMVYTQFKVTNGEGQCYDYDYSRVEEGGKAVINDIPDSEFSAYVPVGGTLRVPFTSSLTYESRYNESVSIWIWGVYSHVDISGSNIDKVQVNEDGTISLYGTDMEYTVSIENMAHTVEYSDTGADDVVLKVVDKQFVEITE